MGHDGISPQVLRACACSLTDPICDLFSNRLETASLPDKWKVTAIPKGGDLAQLNNYRPISLRSVLSKVLESIVFNEIIGFIEPLLSNLQFGFLHHRSMICQLLMCYSEVVHPILRSEEGIQFRPPWGTTIQIVEDWDYRTTLAVVPSIYFITSTTMAVHLLLSQYCPGFLKAVYLVLYFSQ